MVLMIIKGIFRRYEKWNPVHPTYGSFWGMGIGIGCGVGFGPERTHVMDSKEACEAIRLASYFEGEQRNGYRSKPVLFQVSMLAKELQRIQSQDNNVEMWEVVSKVWVEMLCYAATHCDSISNMQLNSTKVVN